MSKSSCLVLVGVALILTAPCARATSLADLITTNGSITVDGLRFSGFSLNIVLASNGATPTSPSAIDVTGVTISGEEGLRFTSNFTAPPPNGLLSLNMSYTVNVLSSGMVLSDMTLAGDPSGPVNSPSGGGEVFSTTSAGNILLSRVGGPAQTHGVFQTSQTNLVINTRMDLAAGGAPGPVVPATFSFLNETFSQTAIPEPNTLLLFLTGVVVLQALIVSDHSLRQ
jgi:hypothetical protein